MVTNKKTMGKNSFLVLLRIMAAFAVVMIHTKTMAPDIYQLEIIHNCIMWCVPIFLMITGYIFLGIKSELTYRSVKKNVIRFIVVLFTFGWFYAFIQRIFEGGELSAVPVFQALLDVVTGNSWEHMWYVYLVLGVYLLLPVFSGFVNANPKGLVILVILSGVLGIVLPDVLSYFDYKSGFELTISGYWFYILSGGLICKISKNNIRKAFIPSIAVLIVLILFMTFYNEFLDPRLGNGYLSMQVALMAISIFLIAANLREIKVPGVIKAMSDCTWGIYLIHPFFIHLFTKVFQIYASGVLGFLIAAVVVFLISFAVTFVLKKMPVIKRII